MSSVGATVCRALGRLGLLVFGLAAVLMPAEIVLRLRGYDAVQFQWLGMVNPQMLELTGNPDLPYVLMPGARGMAWNTEVTINASGARDREFIEDKGGRFRVAAVGDSITFGMDIADPSRLYPAQLERLLQGDHSSRPTEVFNFGVTGYDAVNDVEHLRLRGLRFRPDLVIWQLCVNDIGTASTALQWVNASARLRNPVFQLRVARFVLSRALRLMAERQADQDAELDRFTKDHRARILSIGDDVELRQQMEKVATSVSRPTLRFLPWWKDAPRVGFLEYAFSKMKALQQQQGFDVAVFVVPLLENDDSDASRAVNEIVRHESQKFGFRFVDVFEPFERRGLERLRNLRDDDIHPSPEGHAIIARALHDALRVFPQRARP